MLVQSHDSGDLIGRQGLSLVEDSWAMEVVPRLPTNLAEQAARFTLMVLFSMTGMAILLVSVRSTGWTRLSDDHSSW